MNEKQDRFAEIDRLCNAARDYNPRIPPEICSVCAMPGCDYVWEWLAEWIAHMRLEHPDCCVYCKELMDNRTEHIISIHPNRCPICEYTEDFNFQAKILHLRQFHANNETIRKDGIGVYLR